MPDRRPEATWLPWLVTGRWTGTMNITGAAGRLRPRAAIVCRAVPQADGSFRIHGQKIFITYGDHDGGQHRPLVLARTPDAPAGVKGLSLFLVPKFILDADGNPGRHNDVYCTSIEHKLGVRAG